MQEPPDGLLHEGGHFPTFPSTIEGYKFIPLELYRQKWENAFAQGCFKEGIMFRHGTGFERGECI
jgi:hypothetical protein